MPANEPTTGVSESHYKFCQWALFEASLQSSSRCATAALMRGREVAVSWQARSADLAVQVRGFECAGCGWTNSAVPTFDARPILGIKLTDFIRLAYPEQAKFERNNFIFRRRWSNLASTSEKNNPLSLIACITPAQLS
jgi:hypothetical protein